MRFLKRFNTIFYKLIISYTIITFVVTLTLGVTSYTYFSKNFNNQVKEVHLEMLDHVKNTIDMTILRRVEKIYIDLSSNQHKNASLLFFTNHSVPGNYAMIYNAHQYLYQVAKYNADIVDSIHIYYMQNDLIISSSLGVKFLDQGNREAYRKMDWMDRLDELQNNGSWIRTRDVPQNIEYNLDPIPTITYARSYPFFLKHNIQPGLIAINIRENVISNVIKELTPTSANNTFIVDHDSSIISHTDKLNLYKSFKGKSYINKILYSPTPRDSFIYNIDGVTSMVSFTTLKYTGWKLINISSVNQFYKESYAIQQVLVTICIAALIIGLILTGIFTSSLYNPLKSIIYRVRSAFADSLTYSNKEVNEYSVINEVINQLSVKVHQLEDTLEANQPIIKHNLVIGLLHHTILRQKELADRLNILGLSIHHNYFLALIAKLDDRILSNLSIENSQFIKYNIIKELESFNNNELLCLGAEISDSKIGIFIAANAPQDKLILKLGNHIISYVYSNFMLNITFTAGRWYKDPLKVHNSFSEAQSLFKYCYFLPGTHIFMGSRFLAREESDKTIPNSLIEEFSQALNLRNIRSVKKLIAKLSQYAKDGDYSANHCQQIISNIMYVFSNYAKDMDYKPNENIKNNFYVGFRQVENIIEFENWLISFIEDVFNYIENRNLNRSTEVIEKVKSYICEHLGDDISLDTVADQVYLSPRYLSKLFKEETGMNFIDFVTQKRLEKAKELLIDTDLTIEEISSEVGYNTTTYFIRKFKQMYGDTPKNYKKNYIMKLT